MCQLTQPGGATVTLSAVPMMFQCRGLPEPRDVFQGAGECGWTVELGGLAGGDRG